MPLSEEEREFLIDCLREMVRTNSGKEYSRGYEAGMAFVMVSLGINEAASPQRDSL